jgi:hypothetical protein
MSNNNYFQTPQDTSYGAITHAQPNNLFNPLAHYCTCGGNAETVTTNSELFQVRCTECPSFGVANETKAVAIFNWNMSKLSQFPARLTVLPFRLTNKAKYDPFTLLQHAKSALTNVNKETDPLVASATQYAFKWAQWLTTKHEFVSDDVMSAKMQTFNDEFVEMADAKLSLLQKRYLTVFKKSHQGLNKVTIYRNFLSLHCKEVLAEVQAEIQYPNRLVKAA